MFVKTIVFFINALFLLPTTEATCKAAEEESWSYHSEKNVFSVHNSPHLLGPSAWGQSYPTCNGKEQSPISIDTSNVAANTPGLADRRVPRTIEVQGSLFTFQQLHFHWGNRSDSGSEHEIDNKRYDLE
ncbi:hypothetical protein CEXT_163451, partial [Caerostris extrusa]